MTEDQPTKGFRCLDSIRLNRWQKIQYCPGGLEPSGNCGVRGLFLCKVMGGYQKVGQRMWGTLSNDCRILHCCSSNILMNDTANTGPGRISTMGPG